MNEYLLFRSLKQRQVAVLCTVAASVSVSALAQVTTIPTAVPLRVEIDHRYPVKLGTHVEGHLIAPVYLVDHQVLPANTPVSGQIVATHRVDKGTRANALLNGDFTPLAVPEIRFDQLVLPDGETAEIRTTVVERDGSIVRMKPGKKLSLTQQAKDQIKQREQDALDQINGPGKSDRLLQMLYSQLPYHPQYIWPGTQFDAELTAPLLFSQMDPAAPLPVKPLDEKALTGTLEARLTKDLTSATAKQGDVVDAVLIKPLLDSAEKQVLLPEGTHLEGTVVQAMRARSFARNGKLRFTFRRVELPQSFVAAQPAPPEPVLQSPSQPSPKHQIHGQMIASEANRNQNVAIDSEGGASATGGPDKYIAPLVLGLLASSAAVGDKDNDDVVRTGVQSNGFGLVTRIVTMATMSRGAAQGFAYYAFAKSVYKHWLAKGSDLTFPKNTRIQIELSER